MWNKNPSLYTHLCSWIKESTNPILCYLKKWCLMNMILNKNKGEFIQFTTLIIFTYCTSWTSYSKAFLVVTGNQPQKKSQSQNQQKTLKLSRLCQIKLFRWQSHFKSSLYRRKQTRHKVVCCLVFILVCLIEASCSQKKCSL